MVLVEEDVYQAHCSSFDTASSSFDNNDGDDDESTMTRMTEVPELDEIRERAHRLCREHLRGSWRRIAPYEMIVRKVSGGLSNLLYYCSLPASCPPRHNEPARVLLRLYGQNHGDSALQAIIAESVIFTLLSESQRGPRLWGVFPGGRLEEYIPARPLETDELSDPGLSVLIAQKMAQIHTMSVPINKEPRWLWDTMGRWMTSIEEFMGQTELREESKPMLEQLVTYELQHELDWLRTYLTDVRSPVVFCHNDVQEGNILLRQPDQEHRNKQQEHGKNQEQQARRQQQELVLIDFEYCAYNYRAFDLANHMCEWVYDYSNEQHPYFWARQANYPTDGQKERFVRTYLTSLAAERGGAAPSDEQVQRLTYEVGAFTLASHFFWGLWSVVNASKSTIHFDYWEYGKERFLRYFERKAELNRQSTQQITNQVQL